MKPQGRSSEGRKTSIKSNTATFFLCNYVINFCFNVRGTSILDLFATPNLRAKSLNLFFSWFVNSGTYYGLSLSASNLGGNPYFNFFLSAAVEIPAYLINLALLNQVIGNYVVWLVKVVIRTLLLLLLFVPYCCCCCFMP